MSAVPDVEFAVSLAATLATAPAPTFMPSSSMAFRASRLVFYGVSGVHGYPNAGKIC